MNDRIPAIAHVDPAQADLDVLRSYSSSVLSRATNAERAASAKGWLVFAAELADDLRAAPLTAQAHNLIAARLERYLERANADLSEITK